MTVIRPKWKTPAEVRTLVTTRLTGSLATHVGDAEAALANRDRLRRAYSLPRQPVWLNQQHGNQVFTASEGPDLERPPEADAAFTREYNRPLAVLVADCLPIFLASPDEIAVVHAGWRGLARGVIGRTVARFRNRDIVAWLGPAIGPCHYEVDTVVKSAFEGMAGFSRGRDDEHYMMNLWELARRQLAEVEIHRVEGGGVCTWCDPQFYSHRQDSSPGRFAAIIWRDGGIF